MKRRHRETGACLDREKLGFVSCFLFNSIARISINKISARIIKAKL